MFSVFSYFVLCLYFTFEIFFLFDVLWQVTILYHYSQQIWTLKLLVGIVVGLRRRDTRIQSLTVKFFFRLPGSSTRRAAEPRLVRLKRVQVELGVQICGGNIHGIFVESLDDDSPAKSSDGLLPGDLILEVPYPFN